MEGGGVSAHTQVEYMHGRRYQVRLRGNTSRSTDIISDMATRGRASDATEVAYADIRNKITCNFVDVRTFG